MSSLYYGLNGEPMTSDEWASARSGETWKEARRETKVRDSSVSTVWMGLDHQYGDGPPLVWETMVFGGGLSDECERYTTQAQAHAGHEQMVERVRAEAAAFAEMVADPDVRNAVRLVQSRLDDHAAKWGISDYSDGMHARLAKAVQS